MKKTIQVTIIIFSSAVLFCTCTHRINDPSICYTENVLPILASNCGGCHNELTNYEGTMKYVKKGHPLLSELYKQIKGTNPKMPEGSNKLSQQQLYIIRAWISMGAPNSSNCIACDSAEHKFNADIQPIMKNWCVSCHSSSNASGGYDLSNYNGVVSSINGGKLLGSVKHSAGYLPMPEGGGQISACQINKIQNWINGGFPNN